MVVQDLGERHIWVGMHVIKPFWGGNPPMLLSETCGGNVPAFCRPLSSSAVSLLEATLRLSQSATASGQCPRVEHVVVAVALVEDGDHRAVLCLYHAACSYNL